jgi:hypothetical protein
MANIALNKPSGGQLILSPEDGTSTETVTIPSVGVGKVLQVVQTAVTGASAYNGTDGWLGIGVLTTNITPTSSTSKILVEVSLCIGTTTNLYGHVRMMRNGTAAGIGDSVGTYRNRASFPVSGDTHEWTKADTRVWKYLDSPNTSSQVTYSFEVHIQSGQTLKINTGGGEDEDTATTGARYVSTVTLTEVAA